MLNERIFIVTIAHIPAEDLRNMNRGDILVADAIFRINAVRRKVVGCYNCWVHPSQKYLVEATGLCRTYISRCICKLESMGILQVARKKRRNGKWCVNWYQVGERVVDLCNRIVKGLPIKRFTRAHNKPQQEKKRRILVNTNNKDRGLGRSLRRFFGTVHQFRPFT
ncbi:MAG: hypothetical protein ACUZ8O_14325 [Candidatus Anammoxibacter sp.]